MIDLLFISALIGATLIIARSTLFRPIRRIYPTLLECSQCVGFWVGIAAGVSGLAPTLEHGRLMDAFILGAATSFLAMLADAVLMTMLGDPE